MDESSMETQRPGRYLKEAERKKQRRTRNITIVTVIAAFLCVSLLLVFLLPHKSPYRALCDDGYSGTQEQLLASLIAEELAAQADTAYALAVENGYKKSEADWMKTLTGAEATDDAQSPYQVACANGYEGSLTQWLTHIAEDPDALGKSKDGNLTDYEVAVENSYTGSFAEWLVSLSSEHMY